MPIRLPTLQVGQFGDGLCSVPKTPYCMIIGNCLRLKFFHATQMLPKPNPFLSQPIFPRMKNWLITNGKPDRGRSKRNFASEIFV